MQVQTRPYAMLRTGAEVFRKRLMEYRLPQSILLLADGKGGFWLGGQTALVHWHDGVSETYRTEG